MTYQITFRKKVLKLKESLGFEKTAIRFGISKTTILRWSKNITIQKKRNKPATKINMQALAEDVKQKQDSYIRERAKRLGVSYNCVWKALRRLNITYKKNSKSPKKNRRRQAYI
jgi:transposase